MKHPISRTERAGRRRYLATACLAGLVISTILGAPATAGGEARLYVVWSPEGLPPRAARALKEVSGVRVVTPVRIGIAWLTGSRIGGSKHDAPAPGYGYPMEVAVVSPGPFARFAPGEDRAALRALGRGETVISRTAARVREAGTGMRLRMQGSRVRVTSEVTDRAAQGFEMIVRKPVPRWLGNSIRYLLVRADPNTSRKAMRKAVKSATGSDPPVQIRRDTQVRFLRHAPNVRPLFAFKRSFGEFPARPTESGSLSLLPRWVSRHIRTDRVPLLGKVTCHRKLFGMLRGALRELRDNGLGHLVRPNEYAGCYNPRYVASPPGVRLSRHVWGIALDINTSGNAFGQEPHQDRRLVKTFRRWGFLWGGTWPTPDGMHFEWRRFP